MVRVRLSYVAFVLKDSWGKKQTEQISAKVAAMNLVMLLVLAASVGVFLLSRSVVRKLIGPHDIREDRTMLMRLLNALVGFWSPIGNPGRGNWQRLFRWAVRSPNKWAALWCSARRSGGAMGIWR